MWNTRMATPLADRIKLEYSALKGQSHFSHEEKWPKNRQQFWLKATDTREKQILSEQERL